MSKRTSPNDLREESISQVTNAIRKRKRRGDASRSQESGNQPVNDQRQARDPNGGNSNDDPLTMLSRPSSLFTHTDMDLHRLQYEAIVNSASSTQKPSALNIQNSNDNGAEFENLPVYDSFMENVDEGEDEWEKEGVPEQLPAPVPVPIEAANQEITIDVNIDVGAKDEKENTKSRAWRASREDRAIAEDMHRTHLLGLLIEGYRCSQLTAAEGLQASLLSILPERIAEYSEQHADLDKIETVMQWFLERYKLLWERPCRDLLTEDDLLGIVQNSDREGQVDDLVLVFIALCRLLGWRTRLVQSLHPLPLKPQNPSIRRTQTNTEERKGKVAAAIRRAISVPQGIGSSKPPASTSGDGQPASHPRRHDGEGGASENWCEIYSDKDGKWISVDISSSLVNHPRMMQKQLKIRIVYAVAYCNGSVVDVTPRYAPRMSALHTLRTDELWWGSTLKLIPPRGSKKGKELRQIERLEREEFITASMTEMSSLPTTLQAYRTHPFYAIEKWLGKCDVIYPKTEVLGYVSGNPVYRRDCVHQCLSKDQWFRKGRVVKENEEPVKVVKARKSAKKSLNPEVHDTTVEVYGLWQTARYEAPIACDGKVPKNKYGNIEIWGDFSLPVGTVHLQLPRIANVARLLGVDYAPALMGFEVKGGRSYPKFDGIVVCAEFKETLEEAHYEQESRLVEAGESQRVQRVYDRWKRVLKAVLIKQHVQESYGTPKIAEDTGGKGDKSGADAVAENGPAGDKPSPKPVRISLSGTHVHSYPPENDHEYIEEEDVWRKRCPCGHVVEYEKF